MGGNHGHHIISGGGMALLWGLSALRGADGHAHDRYDREVNARRIHPRRIFQYLI
ncbi:hypothetical protein F750_0873 [Streptomyces sp. PAMC 26508]|nr:hypothetical protein F750_0873 [Streptomyces sp. PAMC 26508]